MNITIAWHNSQSEEKKKSKLRNRALGNFQHPPVLGTEQSTRDVHNIVAQWKEQPRGDRGLVKKSAKLSALRTKGTVSSSSSTFSRLNKCLRWMYFDREWCSGL
eukprot:6184243-Pleurochrysis_carterae.AAC.2